MAAMGTPSRCRCLFIFAILLAVGPSGPAGGAAAARVLQQVGAALQAASAPTLTDPAPNRAAGMIRPVDDNPNRAGVMLKPPSGPSAPRPGELTNSEMMAGGRGERVASVVTQRGNPYNNKFQVFAHAREAEAWSHAKANGIVWTNGATITVAGDLWPGGRSQAMTENGQQTKGRLRVAGGTAPSAPVVLYGTTAIAATDQGYRAFSASNALPLAPDKTPGQLKSVTASTTTKWEPVAFRTGTGSKKLVYSDSTAVTESAPLSSGVSESGGGPSAVAQANEAVAASFADDPRNTDKFSARR